MEYPRPLERFLWIVCLLVELKLAYQQERQLALQSPTARIKSAETALSAADKVMYTAKGRSKNRLVQAEHPFTQERAD